MSVYGEGMYRCAAHGDVFPRQRPLDQLAARDWEVRCPVCGAETQAVATSTDKPLSPTSVYAITKRDQEELCLTVGHAYRIPTVALRYFNVYGPRQSLSNPYTGVLAVFSCRVISGSQPIIFEDGLQSRDFVHVSDVAEANILAMERSELDFSAVNVGTGKAVTILHVAGELIRQIGVGMLPAISQHYRAGDIRHCFADVRALTSLGHEARVDLSDGIAEFVGWAVARDPVDRYEEAARALASRRLVG
jgi:dTDP-L-rhamnose 4-epimerase